MTAAPGSAEYKLAEAEGPLFCAIEVEVYRPGGTYATAGLVHAEAPHGAMPLAAAAATDSDILRASDLGYVSRTSDSIGLQVYVPTLEQGFACNRNLDLQPGTAAYSASWGDLRLASDDRRYDSGLAGRNADQRAVRVLLGRKVRDLSRGLWTDPPYADLAQLFTGLAQPWQAEESALALPVRDYSSYLERPYLQNAYGGTGGLDGTADIAGRLKPRLRGGNSSDPVRNIAPVRIDSVNNVWAISDAEATITTLYENGAAVFTFGGNVSNLYSGSTSAGQYRTDTVNGLFQLGSPNAGQITCDAWGKFPTGTSMFSPPHYLANYQALLMLAMDVLLPDGTFNGNTFGVSSAPGLFESGWYWDGSTQESCGQAVARILASINCRLITQRDGLIACMPLRPIPAGTTAGGSYSTAHIVSLRRVPLPAGVAPPLYRVRWGYQHNHAVLTSGINATVTDARRQFLSTADRFTTAANLAVLTQYRRPNDPQPIPSALLQQADAQLMAQQTLDLWGVERRLYAVELPITLALRHDLGDVLSITYPLDDLDAGRLGQVVGEQVRLGDSTSSLMVLI